MEEAKHFDQKELGGQSGPFFLEVMQSIVKRYQKAGVSNDVVRGSYKMREELGFSKANQEDPHDALLRMLNWYQIKGTGLALVTHYERQLDLEGGKEVEIQQEDGGLISQDGLIKGEAESHLPVVLPISKSFALSQVFKEWLSPQQGMLEACKGTLEGKNYEFPVLSETLKIDALPQSLFVTLGIYNDQYQKSHSCILDVSTLTIEQTIYEIKGIIAHSGSSAREGHYVSYLNVDGDWVCFDDANVKTVSNLSGIQQHMMHQKFDPYMLYLEEAIP